MSTRLEVLAIAGLSLFLACAAALPEPSVFASTDWLRMHLLNRVYASDALLAGRLPLWNPWVALGRPFLADTESAVFYPPNLLYLVLPTQAALFALIVGHFSLAVAGMLRLGRLLDFPAWLAWLQAAVFLLGAPLLLRLPAGQIPYSQAMCYVPLALAASMRAQDEPSGRHVAMLSVVLALQLLCGHPQIAWLTWLALAAFVTGRVTAARMTAAGRADWTPAVAGWLAVAGSLVLALALSAAMLLPFAELAAAGNRSAPALEFAGGGTISWHQWLSLFVPDAGRRFSWPYDLYSGLLVAVGIFGLLRLGDRNARGLLATGVVGFLLAAGPRTPLFSVFFHIVPGVAQLHLHGRAAFLVSFALTLGTGLVLRQPVSGSLRIAALALSASIAWASAVLVQGPGSAPTTWLAEPAARLVLVGLAFALVIPAALQGRAPRAVAARIALVGIVLVELTLALQIARPAWSLSSPSAGERPLFDALLRSGLYPSNGVPPRVLIPPWIARDNAGLIYKWSNASGYNALTLDRVWLYQHALLGLTPPVHENTYPSSRVFERGPFPYDSMNLVVGWDPATNQLVSRPDPDPRAYLVAATRQVAGWREAVRLLAAGHDARREALVEGPVRNLLAASGASAKAMDPGTAQITSFAPERIVVTTAADGSQLLVLAEAYYPGWRASIDGRPAACLPANAWMRAVAVPGGRHTVTFTYHSRWLPLGSLISAFACGALVLLGRRR